MKRFAVLAVFLSGPAFAGDAPVGPTTPQVPPPHIQNGLPTNAPAFDSGPKPFALTSLSRLLKKPAADAPILQAKFPVPANGAAGSPAPAATMHPLPPLPTGLMTAPCGPAGCAPEACAGSARGTCWDKFKKWICYKPCDAGAPHCVPTPCNAPLYSYFPCKENAGYAGGCATGNCSPGRTILARAPKEKCAPEKYAPSCDPLTGPVDAGMPGFRFAAPEAPAVGGAPAPAAPVVNTSFKMPSYGAKSPPK